MNQQDAIPFRKPVNATDKTINLSTIQQRLATSPEACEYTTTTQFVSEFKHMINNCVSMNNTKSQISQKATRLWSYFDNRMVKVCGEVRIHISQSTFFFLYMGQWH